MTAQDLETSFRRCLTRQGMKAKGWTYRSAAKSLGVDWGHLRRVLHGDRPSLRLLAAVESLPSRPTA